jgi:hypothetical protein
MSHQTGIGFLTLPAQTIALTPYITSTVKSQNITARVATLRARQCHGRGTRTRRADIKAKVGSSGYCMTATTKRGRGKVRPFKRYSHYIHLFLPFFLSFFALRWSTQWRFARGGIATFGSQWFAHCSHVTSRLGSHIVHSLQLSSSTVLFRPIVHKFWILESPRKPIIFLLI